MKDESPDQNESEKSKVLSGNSVLLCVACGDFAVAKLQMTTHQCEPIPMCNTVKTKLCGDVGRIRLIILLCVTGWL